MQTGEEQAVASQSYCPASTRSSLQSETLSQTRVRAHKFVLLLASPRFEAHFYGPWAEEANADTFMVNDVSSQTFRNFLDFIYNTALRS